jgi:SAM-dependent methyltransferase
MNNVHTEDIDSKIDEYWDGLVYDIKNMDVTTYMNLLKEKYGATLDEYENMYSGEGMLTPTQTKEIYDYSYKTGLYRDYNPIQEYYRREILKTIVKKLQNKTIIDMGCEDGRISLGLALFGKNRVYGIDMNEYAIEIAEKKRIEYPEISDAVKFQKTDYNSQEFYDYIKENIPEGADTVLFVQPVSAWLYARHKVNELVKEDGNTIITMMHAILNQDPKLEKIRIETDWGTIARGSGMDYNILEYTPFYNRKAILIGEMKR